MNKQPRWFGWNLRSLNVVLFCGGLLAFVVLRIGLAFRVLSWPWQLWAALGAAAVSGLALLLAAWLIAKCVRRRRWKTLTAIAGLCVASLIALAMARNAYLPWTTIEGRVVDAQTGQPLAGLLVYAQMNNGSRPAAKAFLAEERLKLAALLSGGPEVRTDEQGRYRMRALPLGAYNIWAEQPGRTGAAIDSLAGNRNAVTSAPDIRLGPGGIIKGRVIDAATGQPVQLDRPIPYVDAVMFHGPSRPVSGGAVESCTIRSDGTFELRAAPGPNFLYVNGQAPQTPTQVDVKAGETVEVQLFIR